MNVVMINNETWLICGGRAFADQGMFDAIMSHLVATRGCPRTIVHGGARGADAMAGEWGNRMGIDVVACPADWWNHGKNAGPLRNEGMLMGHRPKVVVAFPGGRGTADLIRRAKKRNWIDLIEVKSIDQVLADTPNDPDALTGCADDDLPGSADDWRAALRRTDPETER